MGGNMRLKNKKTGEIKDFGNLQVYAETENTDESQLLGNFDSFKQILEYYEDYILPEPLIKDEKVRKAVRAWYELFDESQLGQFEDGKYIAVGYREFVLQTLDTSLTYTFELPFIDGMQILKQRWGLGADYYTITELCGEEEECES